MITDYKVTEIFCAIDEFCSKMMTELENNLKLGEPKDGKKHRNRKGRMYDSEIMPILVLSHFSGYRTFKDYCLNGVQGRLRHDFPTAVSYNRFVELMPRVFIQMMLFMRLTAFGKCSGITFVDSTMIPVCHNMRRYFNKVFDGLAKDGKVFADRGYISQPLFDSLFDQGVHLVHGLRANMKNKLMPMWDKIMLRKRCIIETVNDLLKNKAQLVLSRHRSVHNFIMIYVEHSQRIVSSTINLRLCLCISRNQDSFPCSDLVKPYPELAYHNAYPLASHTLQTISF